MVWQMIRGHDDLVAGFRRAVGRGRLAHAYLFTGPPGVGKRTFARALAQTLLCPRADVAKLWDACGDCPECHLFAGGTHPDYIEVRRPEDKLELPVELMRDELCAKLSLKPARGDRKIAVLDDADDLNDASANCFLKTLEEPPPGSLLILVGTAIERQLPTIRSRCQVVSFAPLSDTDVATVLVDGGMPREQAEALAPRAGGSPGLALQMAEPELDGFCREFFRWLDGAAVEPRTIAAQFVALAESAGKDASAQRGVASVALQAIAGELRRRLVRGADDGRLMRRLERVLEADLQVERRVQLVLIVEAFVQAMSV